MKAMLTAAMALLALLSPLCEAAQARAAYSAKVVRTAQGVPHITAANMAGLGYGSGYAAAQDNGCVLADALLTYSGERSRWLGADATVSVGFNTISNLESDFFHRAIGDLPALRAAHAATSKDARDLLAGFAAGYNRFLKDSPDRFGAECRGAPWLRPMTTDDMLLAINATMIQASAAPFAAYFTPQPPAAETGTTARFDPARLPVPLARQGIGSNGWAFGAQATGSRSGLLIGNPHFPWEGTNRFRRLHLTIPGKLDVMGAGLLFSPYVAIGFNRDVAWTHTVTTAAHFTLFELQLDPDDPTAYVVDGKSHAMTSREITISVKDTPAVTRTVYDTRYGPVLAAPKLGLGWTKARVFALRDANQANLRSTDTWLSIARARSVAQIRDIVSTTLGIPWVNTIAADRAGNALYADITAVPNVSADHYARCVTPTGKLARGQGVFILDGARSDCDWEIAPATPQPGLMPADRMAATIRRDWVQNSNDSYWLANPAAPFAAHSPLLGDVGVRQGLRTRSGILEITALLAAGPVDMAAAEAMALANKVLLADLILDPVLAACPQRPDLAQACGVLARWDRRADNDSRGALLFFAFAGKLSGAGDYWAVPFDPTDPVNTPRGLNPAAAPKVLDALEKAVAAQGEAGIALDAPLGAYQVARRGDAAIPIHGGPGSIGVLNAMGTVRSGDVFIPFHGSSYMQVVTWGPDGPVADSMLSYSQSSDPASPWYADATRAFSEKQWLRLPFTPAQIAAARVAPPVTIGE